MILSNVNIGTGPSVGDGDPLRTAFNTINTNFTLLQANANALATGSGVSSVAGRTGDVTVTVNDIVGFNPTVYPNAATVGSWITSNVAALVDSAPDALNTLNEIAAALNDDSNVYTTLTNTITTANVNMKGYVDGQVSTLNSTITTANTNVVGYVDSAVSTANVNLKGYVDNELTSYATTSALTTANTNVVGYVDGQVTTLNSAITTANVNMKGYVDNAVGNITVFDQDLNTTDSVTFANVSIPSTLDILPGANVDVLTALNALAGMSVSGQLDIGSNTSINLTNATISIDGDDYLEVSTSDRINVKTGDKTWSFVYGDIGEGTIPTLQFPGTLQSTQTQTALFARTSDLSSNWGMSIDAGNSPYYVDIGELSGSNYWRFSGGSITLPNGAILKDNSGDSIAFGQGAGETSQGHSAVALGEGAGYNTQGNQAIALGRGSGNYQQGIGAVGIGFCAGATSQGDYAVAIGFKAARGNMDADGTPNQPANSIMINASSTPLNGDQSGLYINPVREDTANVAKAVYYNTITKELTYADPTGGGGVNIIENGASNVLIADSGGPITVTANVYTWSFTTNGYLEIPDGDAEVGGFIGDIFGEGMVGIQANTADVNSYASLVSHDYQNAVDAYGDGVRIITDDSAQGGGGTNEWDFSRSGNLTFPDMTVQTTAWNESANAAIIGYVDNAVSAVTFDQDLNTTDDVNFANIGTSTGQISVPTDTSFALRLNHSSFGEANVIVDSQGYMSITGGYTGRSFTQTQPGEAGAIGYFGYSGNVTNISGINGLILDNGVEGSGGIWTFGLDGSLSLAGKLQFPNGAEIRDTSGDLRLRSSPGNVTQLQGIDGSGFVDSAVKAFYDSGSFVTINTNIDAGSPEHIWTFDYNGDLTFPDSSVQSTAAINYTAGNGIAIADGEISVDNTIATYTQLTTANTNMKGYVDDAVSSMPSSYTDANVNALLSSWGSNSLSTTGNITAANFVGNISLTGNVTGTSSNVDIVAGAFTSTFDNQGDVTLPNVTVSGIATIGENLIVSQSALITGNLAIGGWATVSGYSVGYKDIPQVSAGNVTLGLTDGGKHYYTTSSNPTTLTVPSNANVALPIGTAISIVNAGSGTLTINYEAEATLYLAGNATADSRTISSYGMATLLKTATNEWFINGTGLA